MSAPRVFCVVAVLFTAGAAYAQVPAAKPQTPEETALLSTDGAQRDAIAKADLAAIEKLSHPNLRVNTPSNRIVTRSDVLRMVASGEIRNDVFERTPETVQITGDVGVVMGRETVVPAAGTEPAKLYGQRSLSRRYTNVYLREAGAWKLLARQASIVMDAK